MKTCAERSLGVAGNYRMPGALAVAALCSVLCVASYPANAQEKDKVKNKGEVSVTVQGKDTDAGLVISGQATAKEVGLPLYPGAKPSKEDGDGSAAANLGLWGSSFGFKLVVLKMKSNDSTERVAAFYQKALAKYGRVLDCTNSTAVSDDKDKKSHELTCEDDRPEPGERLFKAGTKEKRHLVSVKPNGAGSIFHLVYLEAHDDDKTPL
ncbi:MAG: hypothetical protein WB627_10825 [Candidatus Acidiferrum sp.]